MARASAKPPKKHRLSIDVFPDLVTQLKVAIIRRAALNRQHTGIEPNVSITAWFKDKARETIEEYK